MNEMEENACDTNPESSDKISKIREIINRTFEDELNLKEEEALKIEDEINKTKSILRKLRYAIVSDYYKGESSEIHEQVQRNIQENSLISSGLVELDQKPIHPAIKQLIGKRPAKSDEVHSSENSVPEAEKQPRFEIIDQPAIIQLTSSRGRNKLKHVIVVGNTSQFIKQQPPSDITHKWMCYVRTKSDIPIEHLVSKVRFHLDPTYKPNDVIDVTSSPFQLTRRGYGEFKIKLIIFFKEEVNIKPVQIYHQLELDKRLTGHQVMGSETVTEIFTNDFTE